MALSSSFVSPDDRSLRLERTAAVGQDGDADFVVVVHDIDCGDEFNEQLTTERVAARFVDKGDGHHPAVNLGFDELHYQLLAWGPSLGPPAKAWALNNQ
jgi:hypothetical protein